MQGAKGKGGEVTEHVQLKASQERKQAVAQTELESGVWLV
jgi:hypothetical protein